MKLNKNKPIIQYYAKISFGNKGEKKKRVHCHKTWPQIIDRGISSNSRVEIPEENWNFRKEEEKWKWLSIWVNLINYSYSLKFLKIWLTVANKGENIYSWNL